ncbi:MAG: TetR/AcrR family transcriptional regulator [Solirubrobacterales bacterium]
MTEKIDRRRRRTQKAVLDAAEELFISNGYRDASLEAIAERADVAVSSIYFNFEGGKGDLYLALAKRTAVTNEEVLEPAYDESVDVFEQLIAVGRAYLKFHLDNPLALRLMSLHDVDREGDERVAKARDEIRASIFSMLERLEKLVAQALEAGGNVGVSARAVTVFLFGSWNGVLSMYSRDQLTRKNLKGVLGTGEQLVIGAIRSGNASSLETEGAGK